MASVIYAYGSWVDSGETGLVPGAAMPWQIDISDDLFRFAVVGITAAPVNSDEGDQVLDITDIRSESDSSGKRRVLFNVHNSGPIRAIGYGVSVSLILNS